MTASRPLRVLSNTRWFEGRTVGGRPIEPVPFASGGLRMQVTALRLARRCDAAVINVDGIPLYLLCLAKRLGVRGFRLVSVDVHLPRPVTLRDRMLARVKQWLLQEVDLFICYFKAAHEMQRVYGLDSRRFTYVPFKVNSYDEILAAQPADEGFALVCGRSDRDYDTLIAAATGLDVPIVVLEYVGADRAQYNSAVGRRPLPPNVMVVTDDGSSAAWIDRIRRAKFVVLPVLPGVLKPSGIGTYLLAMALGKCVIVTDSPATQGVIDSTQAVLVPPGDAAALRNAISRVAEDADFRQRIAEAGQAYALSLGDERRLADDVVRHVVALISGEPVARAS